LEATQFDAATTQGRDSEQALIEDDSGFLRGKGDAGTCGIGRTALVNGCEAPTSALPAR
jgi:hypothetical protein